MPDPIRDELQVQHRTAILVCVPDAERGLSKDHVLDELRGLVKTAGVKVVGTLVQNRGAPHPATCLGSGKIEELNELLEATQAELVIFDNNLSPAQGRRLEEETGRIIIDRSELILDIFATHARTHESKLQVELAQLMYTRTRLKRMWTHLERIEGGIGTGRGPGEKQIETDRRLIDHRISELKRQLHGIERRRERLVGQRHDHALVSLVGYTNAGKSTLMRALTSADVYIADQLFATLDTRTRKWGVPGWGDVLLSDTVGFVRDLPHQLVASFKSTLEEARQADLLLHVVDVSNPEAEQQVATVEHVLAEIGVEVRDFILVLNKIDQVENRSMVDVLRARYAHSVTISAATGVGIDRLGAMVAERVSGGRVEVEIEAPVSDGRLLAFLAEHAEIRGQQFTETVSRTHCLIPRQFLGQLPSPQAVVTPIAQRALAEDDEPNHEGDSPIPPLVTTPSA